MATSTVPALDARLAGWGLGVLRIGVGLMLAHGALFAGAAGRGLGIDGVLRERWLASNHRSARVLGWMS